MAEFHNTFWLRSIYAKEDPYGEYNWQCKTSSCVEQYEEMRKQKERERQAEERAEARRIDLETLESDPERILKNYGIPAKYYKSSFDNYKGGEKYVDACRRFITNPENLFITGSFGCGKTHMAVSIIRELFKQDVVYYTMRFKNVPELLLDIRESFRSNDGNNSEGCIIEKYSGVKILVLDDMGAEKTSEYSITTLYTLINRRYNDMKPTIVTTNLTIEQIEKQIHPRIASRFAEYKIMKINMPDYRKNR
uniref:Putative IstB domain protein ATP-binding protein n=1 Tax=viral metagenome TaxID=1070528 RepID=A0A6M3LG55_9ZZZZ